MGIAPENLPEDQTGIPVITAHLAERPVLIFFFLLYLIAIIRNAWMCDDAYITLRTVDNFVQGYGLTWNTAERVQVYTHPLWMLCLSFLYFFTREAYFTTLFFSLTLSAAAGYLTAFRIARSTGAAIIGLACLSSSKAFLDYSTSGLENPLSHLLLAVFILIYRQPKRDLLWLFRVSMIAALAATNRIDTILIYLPALLYSIHHLPRGGRTRTLFKGFTPFILWEIFSLLYYGFPFPNTAYAKLNTGIPASDLIFQGVCYLLNSLTLDPLTLLVILAGIALGFSRSGNFIRPEENKANEFATPQLISTGIVLYLFYVIWIGGDFMSGRFFSAALFGSVALIVSTLTIDLKSSVPVLVMVLLVNLFSPHSQYLLDLGHPLSQQFPVIDNKGVADERAYYHAATGLMNISRHQELPYNAWVLEGRKAREKGADVVTRENIGLFGYYAGPEVHVLDVWALADPLLTRLPLSHQDWRIGHFQREIPDGYIPTLQTGQNHLVDPNTAAYYDKLSILTRGSLFSPPRLLEIILMNLGWYDELIRPAE
jgi:arabinofuranosyltransferase